MHGHFIRPLLLNCSQCSRVGRWISVGGVPTATAPAAAASAATVRGERVTARHGHGEGCAEPFLQLFWML